MNIEQHAIIKVARLSPNVRKRTYTELQGVQRLPMVGDLAEVDTVRADGCCLAECINDQGEVLWLADLKPAEFEIVPRVGDEPSVAVPFAVAA